MLQNGQQKMCKSVVICFIHVNTGTWKSKVTPDSNAKDLLLFRCYFLKQLFFRRNSANLTRSFEGIFEEVCSCDLLFNAKIPSVCGMLGYRLTTAVVIRKESSETLSNLFIL